MERVVLAARIRPPLDRESARKDFYKAAHASDSKTVILEEALAGQNPVIMSKHVFGFDFAFDVDTTETEVYNSVGRIPMETFVNGGNACIIAYGQTGTGKSHTLSSLIPRTLADIFARIPHATASYIEIYNENVYDLLGETQKNLKLVRNADNNGITIESLTNQPVSSIEETLAVLNRGNTARCTAATLMNHQSSRSHAIFTLKISQSQKFHFVDLAGSERLQSSAETRAINRSLSSLGHVIAALTEKNSQRIHIPFRDSKLTRILEDSLASNAVCKTVLLVTISPANEAYGESLSTLKFAERAKSLRTVRPLQRTVKSPTSPGSHAALAEAHEEIRRLERELANERSLRLKSEEKLALVMKRPPADTKTIETLLAKQRDALNSLFAVEPRRPIHDEVENRADLSRLGLPESPKLVSLVTRDAVESPIKTERGGNSVEALIARRRKQLEASRNSVF